ncbi:hypothetical protein Vadar_018119 [Vaccinium darrowii]|uniref:Uncharacterized protein n=1 Tax=Vaccinium darrowii TaxID=229202 RepID=A0ACB7YNT5_9ERIC|nr:hypothetical protein Vadar_018119 [Vaccinium darrowii]
MDPLFPVDDADADFLDRWPHTPSSSFSHHLDTDCEEEQLYFVPYRWWSEARESLFGNNMSAVKGDLYAAESSGAYLEPMGIWGYDMKAEIVLNMTRAHSSTNKLKNNLWTVQKEVITR